MKFSLPGIHTPNGSKPVSSANAASKPSIEKTAAAAGPQADEAPKELTYELLKVYQQLRVDDWKVRNELRDNVVVGFGRGVTGNMNPGYQLVNRRASKALGMKTEEISLHTEQGSEKNAKRIRDFVLGQAKSNKKTLLVMHSKGGVDAHVAVSKYPEIRQHLAGIVFEQSPVLGSPLADFVENQPLLRLAVRAIAFVRRGDINALLDLTTSRRQAFAKENQFPVNEVHAFCIGSTSGHWLSPMSMSKRLIQKKTGQVNDGAVPLENSRLPELPFVQLPGYNHLSAVYPTPFFNTWDSNILTQASIVMALKQAYGPDVLVKG